tara:strand:- start:477 stop:728 length:252 start_codon:yes stop_codon:yes gene_type:complete
MMKLHEVLDVLQSNSDYWFRPIAWQGCGQAYVLKHGMTHLVPSARGGQQSMTCDPRELAGDWEITCADRVLGERNQGADHEGP